MPNQFEPLNSNISVKPIMPGMGSVNIGSPESLVQVQLKNPDRIDIVTHIDPAHDVVSFDYDGNPR